MIMTEKEKRTADLVPSANIIGEPHPPLTEVGDQAFGACMATGIRADSPAASEAESAKNPPRKDANPFGRSAITMRSPTTRRDSVPDLSSAGLEDGVGKMIKAAIPHSDLGTGDIIVIGESPEKRASKRKAEDKREEEADDVTTLIGKMVHLKNATVSCVHTRKDIKDAARDLLEFANRMEWTNYDSKDKRLRPAAQHRRAHRTEDYEEQTKRLRKLKKELDTVRTEMDALKKAMENQQKEAQEEILALKEQQARSATALQGANEDLQQKLREAQEEIRTLKEHPLSRQDAQEEKQTNSAQSLWERLDAAETNLQLEEIFREDWPKAAFTRTTETESSILANTTVKVVFAEDGDPDGEAIMRRLEPEFAGMAQEYAGLQTGEVAIAQAQTNFIKRGRNAMDTSQAYPKTVVVAKQEKYEENEETSKRAKQLGCLVEITRQVLKYLEAQGCEKTRVFFPRSVPTDVARKVLEYCAMSTTSTIEPELSVKGRSDRHRKRTKEDTRASTSTFMIKDGGGKSYAEAMAVLKNKVKLDDTQIEVCNIRETKDGQICVKIIEKTLGGKEAFAKTIREETKMDVQAYGPRWNTQDILVKDLDGTIEVTEIRESILRQLGKEKLEELRISKPRTSKRGGWMAVVSLPKDEARKIIAAKYLRIGWVSRCRVKEYITPTMCFNCQKIGHISRECQLKKTGESVQLCHKCGQTGHNVKACTAKATCHVCNEEGHRATSMACPAYRAAVEEVRKGRAHAGPKTKKTTKNTPDGSGEGTTSKTNPERQQQSRFTQKIRESTGAEWKTIQETAQREEEAAAESDTGDHRGTDETPEDTHHEQD